METHELQIQNKNPTPAYQEATSLLSSENRSDRGSLRHNHSFGFASRLGKFQLTLLVCSYIICFICLAFLTFLWAADTKNATWLRIVLSGWATRSVTITSLILRWTTAVQAMICTSMLAAILLQAGTVRLQTAAAMSIMRYDNTGPWTLLAVRGARWHHGSFHLGMLALLLCFTTLLLQFSSTVLLSQVGINSLPVASSIDRTYYGFNVSGQGAYLGDSSSISFIHNTPIEYPAFAEWTLNASSSDSSTTGWRSGFAPYTGPGIMDTGTVMRAFLPVRDANERSLMTEYHGFGTVVDTRVVCLKPKFKDIVFSTGKGYRLVGQADVDSKPEGLIQDPEYPGGDYVSVSFDCSFSAISWKNYTEVRKWVWPLAICSGRYRGYEQGIYSVMSTAGKEQVGQSYLIVNATLAEAVTTMDGSDVWETVTLQANDSSKATVVTVQVTLCLTAFDAQELDIHATRSLPAHPEPTISWSIPDAAYDTTEILQQLDPIRSAESRGLFTLAPRSWEWTYRTGKVLSSSARYATTEALSKVKDNIYGTMINRAQYAAFTRIARSTRNPALALQAYFTTLCAIAYRDRMNTFDKAASSMRVSLVQVTRPKGWMGYTIVVSVLGIHLVVVIVVTLLFCRAGKLSRVGNAWAAVSQLLGPATEDWIRDVNSRDDKMMGRWLKENGKEGVLVQLEEVDGRVIVVRKDKVS
ncbi:hypothetical protein BKA63DRAFT_519672 [Paraphoma chrysanthemicola]|nr:hypothetical protein BKA63DRAFT_519672 [Paraphoma chrysanthemicola]